MAKPNYSFEKRQRELAKKRKKEEKAHRKASPSSGMDGEQAADTGEEQEPGGEPAQAPQPALPGDPASG